MTWPNGRLLSIREVCPKDFYWYNIMENDHKDVNEQAVLLLFFARLTSEGESCLDYIPANVMKALVEWMVKELLTENMMKVEKWLEIAFHLCKQRWDDSIDWLETQPMSKIMLMIRIQSGFNESQNKAMKRAGRK